MILVPAGNCLRGDDISVQACSYDEMKTITPQQTDKYYILITCLLVSHSKAQLSDTFSNRPHQKNGL